MQRLFGSTSIKAVAALCTVFAAGCTESQQLEGAWNLRDYVMAGEEQEDVSGLLVMVDGRFGLIYTMQRSGEIAGRGHAGGYTAEQDQLIFDVEWWPEEVDGAARAAAPAREVAEIDQDGDILEMRFGSGSLQRWQRVAAGGEDDSSGAWQVESVESDGQQQDAEGEFVYSSGRFTLFAETAGEDGSADVRAYGGTSRSTGEADNLALTSNWQVAFIDGDGDLSNDEQSMTLQSSGSETAVLKGPDGRLYGLQR